MKIKNIVTLLFAVVVGVTFAGCGKKNNNNNNTELSQYEQAKFILEGVYRAEFGELPTVNTQTQSVSVMSDDEVTELPPIGDMDIYDYVTQYGEDYTEGNGVTSNPFETIFEIVFKSFNWVKDTYGENIFDGIYNTNFNGFTNTEYDEVMEDIVPSTIDITEVYNGTFIGFCELEHWNGYPATGTINIHYNSPSDYGYAIFFDCKENGDLIGSIVIIMNKATNTNIALVSLPFSSAIINGKSLDYQSNIWLPAAINKIDEIRPTIYQNRRRVTKTNVNNTEVFTCEVVNL